MPQYIRWEAKKETQCQSLAATCVCTHTVYLYTHVISLINAHHIPHTPNGRNIYIYAHTHMHVYMYTYKLQGYGDHIHTYIYIIEKKRSRNNRCKTNSVVVSLQSDWI